MKKWILIGIASLLTSCGGSDYFNSASSDTTSCLIGTWEEQDLSYPETSRVIQYFDDGTYVSQQIIDFGTPLLSTIYYYLLNLAIDFPVGESFRYIAHSERGSWVTEDRTLRRFDRATLSVHGNDLEDITVRSLEGVMEKEPQTDARQEALSVHCDDEYTTSVYRNVFVQTGDSPLEYTTVRNTYNPDGVLSQSHSETMTLRDDGHATIHVVNDNPLGTSPNIDVINDYDYRYSNGKLILIGCEQSESCPKPGRSIEVEYFDRGTALVPEEPYFIRITD